MEAHETRHEAHEGGSAGDAAQAPESEVPANSGAGAESHETLLGGMFGGRLSGAWREVWSTPPFLSSSRQPWQGDGASGSAASRDDVDLEAGRGGDEPPTLSPAEIDAAAQQSPSSVRSVGRWLEVTAPFLLMFFFLFVLEHLGGVFVLMLFSATLWKVNEHMRRQLNERRRPGVLICILLCTVLQGVLVYATGMWEERPLWSHMALMPFKIGGLGFFDVMWLVAFNDLLVRHLSAGMKAISLLVMGTSSQQRMLSQTMNAEEALAAMYRDLLPVPVWYAFLSTSPSDAYLRGVARIAYLSLKISILSKDTRFFVTAARALALRQTPYGEYVKGEELERLAGEEETCAICHEEYTHPVRIACRHVFCERCVSEWLRREVTCPLCRTHVRPAGHSTLREDGTTPVLPLLF